MENIQDNSKKIGPRKLSYSQKTKNSLESKRKRSESNNRQRKFSPLNHELEESLHTTNLNIDTSLN